MNDLTNDELKILLEVLASISIPVNQAEEIVIPLKNKLKTELLTRKPEEKTDIKQN